MVLLAGLASSLAVQLFIGFLASAMLFLALGA